MCIKQYQQHRDRDRQQQTTTDNNRQDQEVRRTTETSTNKGRREETAEMIKWGVKLLSDTKCSDNQPQKAQSLS